MKFKDMINQLPFDKREEVRQHFRKLAIMFSLSIVAVGLLGMCLIIDELEIKDLSQLDDKNLQTILQYSDCPTLINLLHHSSKHASEDIQSVIQSKECS